MEAIAAPRDPRRETQEPIQPPTAVSAPGYRKKMAAKIQIAGLFASSRQEGDDAECDEEDDGEDPAGIMAGVDDEDAAAGNGRLRMANASRRRNSATDPRK